jgi:hypothetical protein
VVILKRQFRYWKEPFRKALNWFFKPEKLIWNPAHAETNYTFVLDEVLKSNQRIVMLDQKVFRTQQRTNFGKLKGQKPEQRSIILLYKGHSVKDISVDNLIKCPLYSEEIFGKTPKF